MVFKDDAYNDAPHFIGLVKYQGYYDCLTSIPALLNQSYYCTIAIGVIIQRMSIIIIAKVRIALPVRVRIRRVLILPPGSSLPLIAPIVIASFMVPIVLKPIKPKARRKMTKVCVNRGVNVYFAVPSTMCSPPHKCYHITCTNCGAFKHVSHRCFIQPTVEKPPKEQQEEEEEEDPL